MGPSSSASPRSPGRQTIGPASTRELPTRYYQFSLGPVDVFALDSNTLDAPPPGADAAAVRAEATIRGRALRAEAARSTRRSRSPRAELERWRADERARFAADLERRARLAASSRTLAAALEALAARLGYHHSRRTSGRRGARSWRRPIASSRRAPIGDDALRRHLPASTAIQAALREVEDRLVQLPAGQERRAVTEARDTADRAQAARAAVLEAPPPEALAARMRDRPSRRSSPGKLATEIRREDFVPDDYDVASSSG